MSGLLEGAKYDPANVQAGTPLYVSNCVFCHGMPGVNKGGNIRKSWLRPTEESRGQLVERGMPDFTGKLKDDDVTKIQAFIQGTADAIRPKK